MEQPISLVMGEGNHIWERMRDCFLKALNLFNKLLLHPPSANGRFQCFEIAREEWHSSGEEESSGCKGCKTE